MRKLSVRLSAEITADDDTDRKCIQAVEIELARICENIEAIVVEKVQPLYPGVKITCGGEWPE